jgi:hypothetical protein
MAVEPPGQVVDPVRLGFDRLAEVGDGGEQLPDHPLECRHVGWERWARRILHARFNTAGRRK